MKKKVLFIVNHDLVIFNFRRELVEELLKQGYDVHIVSPHGERIEFLISMGCVYHEVKVDRHGKSIFKDLALLLSYVKVMRSVCPNVVLTYTVKPNIYGAIGARFLNIPCLVNITGLGTALSEEGITKRILSMLYKISMKRVDTIFFQNEDNMNFFLNKKLVTNNYCLLPGSGVNLDRFSLLPYPKTGKIVFSYISRIMKEKGIDNFLEAAETLKGRHDNLEFRVYGFLDGDYESEINDYSKRKIIEYYGMVLDVNDALNESNCTILPSYYPEGISNVLLESASTGRPLITTNHTGCRETVSVGYNGYLFEPRSTVGLIDKIEQFLKLSPEQQEQMGKNSREFVSKKFSRKIVVEKYMDRIARF